MEGGSISGSTASVLITAGLNKLKMVGVDLSAYGSGTTLYSDTSGGQVSTMAFINCKLGAGVTIATPSSILYDQPRISVVSSDSAGTSYRTENYQKGGSQVTETSIVRAGGASDGATPISWKIVTEAFAGYVNWARPYEVLPIVAWNDKTSSVTVTIYGIWGGGAVPNNDDIWIDAQYMGSAASPLATIATLTKANGLTAGSALASDSSSWGGSTTPFKMSLTLSPAMKGPIYIYPKVGRANSTFYIDPKVVFS